MGQEALDSAKLVGRGAFVCYESSRMRTAERKHNLDAATEILQGLNEQRLRVAYQPIMAIDGETIAFYECLMRLEREDGTIVSAKDLIPVAEKLGLVRLVDHRMLTLALKELSTYPDICLSLNLSPQSVVNGEWLDTLTAGLRRVPENVAARLIVELTEAAAIENLDETSGFISKVRDLGAKVAIDDFGAGYTSFRNLKNLEIDFIKIDGSFIENLAKDREDRIFVRTFVDLARAFTFETIAEWVSDQESIELLGDMGIDYVQGDYLASPALTRPWAPDEIENSGGNGDPDLELSVV